MSKIKYGWLDQYGAAPFDQQRFGTAGVERVNAEDIVQDSCDCCIAQENSLSSCESWHFTFHTVPNCK